MCGRRSRRFIHGPCGRARWSQPRHRHREEQRTNTRPRTDTGRIRLIWNALEDDDYGSIMKLLALTGQRENEIGSLSWSEIYDAEIILPAERTKNARPHVVPLSPLGARHHRIARTAAGPRSDIWPWRAAAFRLVKIKGTIGRADQGGQRRQGNIAHWTFTICVGSFATYAGGGLPEHEFKKLTARDKEFARGLGILPHVVEAILNHVSGHKAGVAGITTDRPMPRKNAPRSTNGRRIWN